MCEVPSWIEAEETGVAWFLVDKDIERAMEDGKLKNWEDVIGHSAIEKLFGVKGNPKEGADGLPEAFREAIATGQCDRMIRVDPGTALRNIGHLLDLERWSKAEDHSAHRGVRWAGPPHG